MLKYTLRNEKVLVFLLLLIREVNLENGAQSKEIQCVLLQNYQITYFTSFYRILQPVYI